MMVGKPFAPDYTLGWSGTIVESPLAEAPQACLGFGKHFFRGHWAAISGHSLVRVCRWFGTCQVRVDSKPSPDVPACSTQFGRFTKMIRSTRARIVRSGGEDPNGTISLVP